LVMDAPVFAGASFDIVYEVVDAEVPLVATVQGSAQLTVANATPPVTWRRIAGALPQGVSFQRSGLISGVPLDLGDFPLSVTATDGQGLTDTATVTLRVDAPPIATDDLTSAFLGGATTLTSVQQIFLDRQGNQNGAYDLGDFRRWILAHPEAPEEPPAAATGERAGGEAQPRRVVVPMRLHPPEEQR
ncbi:MAG TPA: putative Ig domain-containing protein, partial [Longimicrobiales bacterium]|nr:putative Ig domain-containing protein [Longimicrobiales bacterium]